MPFHRLTIEAQTFAVVEHFASAHVLLMGHPFQVLHAVVQRVAVEVVALVAFRLGTDPRLQYSVMNQDVVVTGIQLIMLVLPLARSLLFRDSPHILLQPLESPAEDGVTLALCTRVQRVFCPF